MSERLLLERVIAAAEERHLSENTLIAYRRTWIKAHRLGGRRRSCARNLAIGEGRCSLGFNCFFCASY